MSLPKEAIVFIIKNAASPEAAANLIAKYEQVQSRVASRGAIIGRIRSEAEKRIKKLLAEKICDHPVVKNHGDPSGNGDSSTECLICGEWVRERAARFT
jgi:hypothetical protein